MKRVRQHLTYANVVATLALFLALTTGGVYAASKLKANSVGTKQIKNGAVTNPKLATGAVTSDKLGGSINANTLGGIGPSGFAPAQAEPWHEADLFFCNGYTISLWRNFGGSNSTAAYFRDSGGVVHIKGTVKCPFDAQIDDDERILILPDGYVPSQIENFPSLDNTGQARTISMDPDGTLKLATGAVPANEALYLDGISFRCQPSGSNGCP